MITAPLVAIQLMIPPTGINVPVGQSETLRAAVACLAPSRADTSVLGSFARSATTPLVGQTGRAAPYRADTFVLGPFTRSATTLLTGVQGQIPRFVATESAEAARRSAITRLQNRVSDFRFEPPGEGEPDDGSWKAAAIRSTIDVISQIPPNLPFPNAMLLSSQISLYWDLGKTYAEIAIGGDGAVSIYGKRPGRQEVLRDTTIDELRTTDSLFPVVLNGILLS